VFEQRREGFVDLKVREDNLRARRLYESVGMYAVRREPVPL
jgi:ribosomal protein S18 acetylase RimI-like enzyme